MPLLRAVVLVVATTAAVSAHAATLQVPLDHPTIAGAIDAATAGDRIEVAGGVWAERLVIDKDLSLVGVDGADLTRITDAYAGSVVRLEATAAHVEGFEVTNTSTGGAILVREAAVTLVGMRVVDNHATGDGAGLRVEADAKVTVASSAFDDNSTNGSGSHIHASGAGSVVTVEGSSFAGGRANLDGGGIYVAGDGASLWVDDCVFDDNDSYFGSGGAIASSGSVTVDGAVFTGNSAVAGGAIGLQDADATIRRSTFDTNTATVGGAVWNTSPDLAFTVEDSQFTANAAQTAGAVYVAELAEVTGHRNLFCTNHATAGDGGAVVQIEAGGGFDAVWANNLFVENDASQRGGALFAADSSTEVRNNHFLTNSAGADGGGAAFDDAQARFDANLVAWNASGGGLWAISQPVVFRYTAFEANTPADVAGQTVDGPGNLSGDPQLVSYSPDGDCTNDRFWLAPSSPLIDAGSQSTDDLDGSRADIGAYGGPYATADVDGDGVPWTEDCADQDPGVFPGATEVCDDDNVDDDCDGLADDADPEGAAGMTSWFADADQDGYGDPSDSVVACDPPASMVADGTDCDDSDSATHPGATERCDDDDIDQDCDGFADDLDPQGASDTTSWYADRDDDGWGNALDVVVACDMPVGRVAVPGDCDDDDATAYPGAEETYEDGVDQDCDGVDPGVQYGNASCGCGGGVPPRGWALLGVLALVRRRR